MPPATNLPNPTIDTSHQLVAHNKPQKSGAGAWIGAAIIVVLLGFGALYFYGAYLNKKNSPEQLPFIPGDSTQSFE